MHTTRKRPVIRERDIQQTILDWLRVHRIVHFRMNTGGYAIPANGNHARRFIRFGAKGMADILALHKGRAYAIEVKTDKTEQSRWQMEFQSQWQAAGGTYIVARSIEDVHIGIGI